MDKQIILYIVLAILAFSVFYRVATVPEEKRAPLKYKTGAKSSELGVQSSEFKTGKEDIPRIELSKLTSAKGKPPADGVNLFYPFCGRAQRPNPALAGPPRGRDHPEGAGLLKLFLNR